MSECDVLGILSGTLTVIIYGNLTIGLPSFCKWGDWGSEGLSNLPKVSHLVSDEAGLQSQSSLFEATFELSDIPTH